MYARVAAFENADMSQVDELIANVEERTRTGSDVGGIILLGALVLLLVAAPASAVSSAVPQKLVGTWVAKNGLRMTIKKTGRVVFTAPGVGNETTTLAVTATRATFGPTPTCARRTVYSWRLSGGTLTFKVVRDPCRRGVLWLGPWRKR